MRKSRLRSPAGEGRLSGRFTVEHATTGANGRAENTLTLGSNPEPNIVEVSVAGLEPVTFNAVGVGTPTTSIMGGDYRDMAFTRWRNDPPGKRTHW